jgi:cytochrome c-type biogenesis protein CcmF
MFPVISEAVTGSKITVGPPFFNSVMVPIGLLLLLMTGVGPLLAWRKTSKRNLQRQFTAPVAAAVITGAAFAALGMRDMYAVISFAFSAFVVMTILLEFHRGAVARGSSAGESYPQAVVNLIRRNRRRYGGYIIHFGIVLLFIGFTGNAFNQDTEAALKFGESVDIGEYRLVYEGSDETTNPLTAVIQTQLGVFRRGERLGTLWPEQHVYYKRPDQQRTTEVAIRSSLREDLYVLYEGQNNEGVAFFRAYVNPLVIWVWIGAWVLTIGTVIVMFPDKREEELRHKLSREALA